MADRLKKMALVCATTLALIASASHAAEKATQKDDCFVNGLSAKFSQFHENWYGKNTPLMNDLKKGQAPAALVIACSDSRVDPAIVTASRPGDIFVLRNVANLVFPYEGSQLAMGQNAAIEYAVKHLHVRDIIVMGHSTCGGINALVSSKNPGKDAHHHGEPDEFIGAWIAGADAAYAKVDKMNPKASIAEKAKATEKMSARLSVENLLTFPWIKKAVDEGKLHVHAMYFDLQKEELLVFDAKKNDYRKVD